MAKTEITGLLGDTHWPYAKEKVYNIILDQFEKAGVDRIILSGDWIDFHRTSFYRTDPNKPSTKHEIEVARKKLTELRQKFPNTKIEYLIANHDRRFANYIIDKAPELYGVDGINLEAMLGFKENNIQAIDNMKRASQGKSPVRLGNTYLIHGGDEVKVGWGGAHLARTYYLKAFRSLLVFHHHQKQVFKVRKIDTKYDEVNLFGCVCSKSEPFAPYPQWQWGFGIVEHNNKAHKHKVYNYEITDDYEVIL